MSICPFMLSIVSKMVNEHHIKPNRSNKNICYIVCNLHVRRQRSPIGVCIARGCIDAICHARLKVFHEMVEKETGWKHLYYE